MEFPTMPDAVSQEELLKEFPHINRGLDGIVAFSTTKFHQW